MRKSSRLYLHGRYGLTESPNDGPQLTVGDLVAWLRRFPDEAPVGALYDCRCAEGVVVAVERDEGAGGGAVLIVE